MHSPVSMLDRILGRAARRHRAQRAMDRAGRLGTAGVAVAFTVLIIDRLLGTSGLGPWLATWIPYAAIAGTAVLLGAAAGWFAPVDRHALAARIDRALDLDDRLGSAVALEARLAKPSLRARHDAAFASFVQQDAERVAGRVIVRDVAPWSVSGIWGACLVGAVALVPAALLVPRVAWASGPSPEAVAEAEAADRLAAAEEIESSIAAIESDLPPDAPDDAPVREDLAALDRLARQLRGDQGTDARAAREEAAARLAQMADRIERETEADRAAADALARRFGEPPVTPEAPAETGPEPPMSAREFAEAVRSGDFGGATDELERMLEEAEQWSDAERRSAADALRDLSDAAEANETETRRRLEENRERLAQALRDQGLDDATVDDLLDRTPPDAPPDAPPQEDAAEAPAPDQPDATEDRLRREGVDEDVARELARDIDDHADRASEERRADDEAHRLADAMNRSADDIEQSREPRDDAARERQGEGAPTVPQPDQSGEQPAREGQTREGQPESGPPEQGDPKQGRPGQAPPDQTQPGASDPGQSERVQSEPGQSKPGQSEPGQSEPTQSAPDPPKPGQPKQPQTGQADEGQGGQTEGAEPREGDAESATPSGDGAQRPPDGAAPDDAGQPEGTPPAGAPSEGGQPGGAPPDESPTETLRRMLREFSERRGPSSPPDGTGPPTEGAPPERLRDMAREIAENMTDEEREAWRREWERQGGAIPNGDDAGGGSDAGDGDTPLRTGTAPPERATTPEDVRPADDGDPGATRLFEWTDPRRVAPSRSESTGGTAGASQAAQRAAERAIDSRTVPSRYHRLIERYFRRIAEQGADSGHAESSGSP